MLRKFGSWLWWKKPSSDAENSPATSSLDGSFGGHSPTLDSVPSSDGRRPASPRGGRPGSPNNRPVLLHWIFSAKCVDGTILPEADNPERWSWIETEVVRRFAYERCDCHSAVSTHQHSISSPRRGGARPELPAVVLELGEQHHHSEGVIDTLAAADLIEEWVRAFRSRPDAIVCYCTYPASAIISGGRPSLDYSDFFRFPSKVLEELRLRATLPWAEQGHEVAFLFSSSGAPRALTDFLLHRSPERIITVPSSDPSVVLGHQKMVTPLTVSPASPQPPSLAFGGPPARQDFRPLAPFVAIDCDEPFRAAHLQTTKSVSPGSSPTATSLDATLVDQGMVLLQAAAVSIYEDLRDALLTRQYELKNVKTQRGSPSYTAGTFAHQQESLHHGESEAADNSEMTSASTGSMHRGDLSSASIDLNSNSCVSIHLLKDLPTMSLKTLEVVLKNLSPLLSKDRERYLVLNHTSDRFQKVVGQYPLAMSVLGNVGFMSAEYMDEGGGAGNLSPRMSPSNPMHRMALPKVLLLFFTPEIERTLRATQAEIDRRESAKVVATDRVA